MARLAAVGVLLFLMVAVAPVTAGTHEYPPMTKGYTNGYLGDVVYRSYVLNCEADKGQVCFEVPDGYDYVRLKMDDPAEEHGPVAAYVEYVSSYGNVVASRIQCSYYGHQSYPIHEWTAEVHVTMMGPAAATECYRSGTPPQPGVAATNGTVTAEFNTGIVIYPI